MSAAGWPNAHKMLRCVALEGLECWNRLAGAQVQANQALKFWFLTSMPILISDVVSGSLELIIPKNLKYASTTLRY